MNYCPNPYKNHAKLNFLIFQQNAPQNFAGRGEIDYFLVKI